MRHNCFVNWVRETGDHVRLSSPYCVFCLSVPATMLAASVNVKSHA